MLKAVGLAREVQPGSRAYVIALQPGHSVSNLIAEVQPRVILIVGRQMAAAPILMPSPAAARQAARERQASSSESSSAMSPNTWNAPAPRSAWAPWAAPGGQ